MFRNKLDYIYPVLCLMAYILVIIYINSFITLFLLVLLFVIMSLNNNHYLYLIFYFLCFIYLVLCYYNNDYLLIRLLLVISYAIYYLDIDNLINNKIFWDNKKKVKKNDDKINEIEYFRFKNNIFKEHEYNKLFYLLFHFIFLCFSIMVG